MIIPGSTASFLTKSFLIRATLIANLQVEIDYIKSSLRGLIVAIIRVLQFPPIESRKIVVIKD